MKIIELKADGSAELKRLINGRTAEDLNPYREQVLKIVENVRRTGDMAVREYTRRFDQVEISADQLLVKTKELDQALEGVNTEFLSALKLAEKRIYKYHQAQRENFFQKSSTDSWNLSEDGIIMGQLLRPLERVGVYVPGGRAVYPSSVLMTVIPAKVAGVKEVIMVTPPEKTGQINPYILAAAKIAGVDRIYKVGGAQAIAALAFGTDLIPKVDKIVGPGNIYVTLAKQLVYGLVDIDLIAGPSEIVILADETANPQYLAADLLSQAEHDPLAAAILITTSARLATAVQNEVEAQSKQLSRVQIIQNSLKNYGRIIIVKTIEQGIEVANQLAPEHLELAVKDPFAVMADVKNAGAIFLGEYTPEPVGDYLAGPNHVLPTNGTARFFSPLGVNDFIKFSSFLSYSKEALQKVQTEIINLAEVEGLEGHANAIRVRFLKEGQGD